MELDTGFSVVAPIDTVWKVLLDFDRVAASVPGAEILERPSDDTLKVGMKVKLGPVSMQYKGTVNVLELDEAQHRAVFGGKAQETRGQGTAEGTATMQLTQDGETTVGTVHAELNLSGRAAAMGKSIINSVTQQMVELFASNLQKMVEEELSGGSSAAGVPAAEAIPAAEATPAAEAPTAVAPPATEAADASTADTPTPPTHPAPPRPPAPAENSLNALSLARGVIVDQLQNPAKLAVALLAVGFIGFLIGRGRRRRV
ncbi:MAG TPA: SRPBCC family protein [Diaminobutyricibacter sp.]